MVSLPDGGKISKICLFVLTWSTNVTDGQRDGRTDRQTDTAWQQRPRLCIASHGKKWFFGGVEGEDVKILCSNPRKACMNTHLLVYRMSKSVQWPKLYVCIKLLRTYKKNWVVTLAIWEEVTPGAILTKYGMCADMVDVITCAIFGDCWLRGVGVVRGVILRSCNDLRCRPYNTGDRLMTVIWFWSAICLMLNGCAVLLTSWSTYS